MYILALGTNGLFLGPPPSAAPRVNNNVQSNFKRQNTVDTATIKENTPRYSGSRPATATAVTSKTSSSQQGTKEFYIDLCLYFGIFEFTILLFEF